MNVTLTNSLGNGKCRIRMVKIQFKHVKAYYIKTTAELYLTFSFDFYLDNRDQKIEVVAKTSSTGNIIYIRSYIHSVGYNLSPHSDEELKENIKVIMASMLFRWVTVENSVVNIYGI